jgi:hypothetical protein
MLNSIEVMGIPRRPGMSSNGRKITGIALLMFFLTAATHLYHIGGIGSSQVIKIFRNERLM